MRALISDSLMTKFMQAADVFLKNKVIYTDMDLNYCYEENDKKVILIEEKDILAAALVEFKENLILLFGKDKPLYINPNVQCISTGHQWTRLIDVLKQSYPKLKFETDEFLMNIKVDEKV